jgi:uncharacterized protein YqeY
MSLQTKINDEIKNAMKSKDPLSLEALRAVKSAILLELTNGIIKEDLTQEEEIKLLQRLVKQRKDSAQIYTQQNRVDLAFPELEQSKIIEKFLPIQLSEIEVEIIIAKIIADNNFAGIASMGQVMGLSNKEMAGKADGKTISNIVKKLLN